MNEAPHFLVRYEGYNGAVLERKLMVKRQTLKGVWIDDGPGYPERLKFVLLSGRKRYAYPDKEEALASFIKRKEWHLVHLERQTKNTEHALANAKAGQIGYGHQLPETASIDDFDWR